MGLKCLSLFFGGIVMADLWRQIHEKGLWRPDFEHDNCGIGAIVDIEGRSSHKLVDDALSIVENLDVNT